MKPSLSQIIAMSSFIMVPILSGCKEKNMGQKYSIQTNTYYTSQPTNISSNTIKREYILKSKRRCATTA